MREVGLHSSSTRDHWTIPLKQLGQGRDKGLSFAVTTGECSGHREQTLPGPKKPRVRRVSVARAEWVRVVEVRLRG